MDEEVAKIKIEPEFIIDDSDCTNDKEKIIQTGDIGRDKEQCTYCSNHYSKGYIKIHLRTHSGAKPYKCDWREEGGVECGRCFMRLEHLRRHKGIHTGTRLHNCDVCLKRFARNDQLNIHRRIHLGYKPYSCEICMKMFGRLDHMRKHFRTHFKDNELSQRTVS